MWKGINLIFIFFQDPTLQSRQERCFLRWMRSIYACLWTFRMWLWDQLQTTQLFCLQISWWHLMAKIGWIYYCQIQAWKNPSKFWQNIGAGFACNLDAAMRQSACCLQRSWRWRSRAKFTGMKGAVPCLLDGSTFLAMFWVWLLEGFDRNKLR